MHTAIYEQWKDNIVNQHLVFINGVEVVEHEFKEILMEMAIRLKDFVDSEPGKLKSLVRKFMQNLFLRRLLPFIKFTQIKAQPENTELPSRKWPESQKDKEIEVIMIEKLKQEAEMRKVHEEEDGKRKEEEAKAEAERLEQEAIA
jgi:regulator of protease activity HflC (stomatin/prohibitin superfamily)